MYLPKRTKTSLITESDHSGPNHQVLQLCQPAQPGPIREPCIAALASFILYRTISQREGERKEKWWTREKGQTIPPSPNASEVGPCPAIIQIRRTPWHWKLTQHHRTTRPPLTFLENLSDWQVHQLSDRSSFPRRSCVTVSFYLKKSGWDFSVSIDVWLYFLPMTSKNLWNLEFWRHFKVACELS